MSELVKVNTKKKKKGKNTFSSSKTLGLPEGKVRALNLQPRVIPHAEMHKRDGVWKQALKAAKVFRVTSGGIPRSLRPFWGPARHKFRYADYLALSTGAAGTTGVHSWSCNSLYDPDQTGTGHQPLGFDELKVFFDHYIVLAATMRLRISADGASAGYGSNVLVGIMLTDDLTTATDPTVMLEQPFGVSTELSLTLTKGESFKQISHHWTAKEWYNLADPMDAFSNIGALYSANPTEQAYFTVWAADSNAGDSSRSLRISVEIDYDAVLLEPAEIGLS
jgi:hypothetical protein